MAKKIADAQKKLIIADFSETGSYRETARRFGVADQTVRRICQREPELSRIVGQKKKQNTLDMLAYMDSRKEQAQGVIDSYLSALADPAKIKTAKLSEVATAMGILVDKFTKNALQIAGDAAVTIIDDIPRLLEHVKTLDEIAGHPVENRNIDDFS